MQTEPFVNLFGPVDALHGHIEAVLLALVLLNMVTRFLAHRHYVHQYDNDEDISRWIPHEISNVLTLLTSFYYLTLAHNGGIVASMLVVTFVITDIFEFESRKVEARQEMVLERPKASLGAWFLALLYVAYQVAFTGPIDALL